ncbi:MAG TPA: hypothetical protein VFO55_00660 [Gemmatimonadaceae bacterium]|nr:hypothetical protein [Gemmatimonadaceae bacterium]
MSLAAVAVMASNAFAQAKTSFAGTWNMVVDPAAQQSAGGGGRGRGGMGGFGPTFTVTQDEKVLTITRTMGENTMSQTYNLDGSESKNTMPGRAGNPGMEQISKASWDGANLVITRKQQTPNGEVEIKQVFSLAADVLTIETIRPGQDGAPMSTKVQYKKG